MDHASPLFLPYANLSVDEAMRQTIKRPSMFLPGTVGASFDNYAVQFFRKKFTNLAG
jgi:hypothetical protein